MKAVKAIELDGRTGEGGGQLVRIAVALAAVTTQPIRITHIRGKRGTGIRGGGLKAQHVASIDWLAQATDAAVTGLAVGSDTLEFRPRLRPSQLATRRIKIAADTAAASTLLVLQAVLPYLLFAAGDPIELELCGGTNVSWSLSYEYLDQVLLPSLQQWFGIEVERRLEVRGWSHGSSPQRGKLVLKIHPLKSGDSLQLADAARRKFGAQDFELKVIDASVLVPSDMHAEFQQALLKNLDELFPGVEVNFKVMEDSRSEARVNVLLVAKTETLRWGRDILCSALKRKKGKEQRDTAAIGAKDKASKGATFADDVSRKVCRDLYEELKLKGTVDEFLQDQLVIFQALAQGETSFPRSNDGLTGRISAAKLESALSELEIDQGRRRKDKMHEPFGEGSMHTTTARWVTAELLPSVRWFSKGSVCEGVGMRTEQSS
ncbi:EPT/RTPC-like protein [Myriangium duriaei CBS 260.36]|uniref:EPT/RTPC-like protein n=1 Tax=Myriangium duriaei CBS 260.36 TaxID=1168546 RepID=A0A9P4J4R5_9PEZI|nr:EPT/RTPC-like protein [Myriangium duriaei CBS 260.36]